MEPINTAQPSSNYSCYCSRIQYAQEDSFAPMDEFRLIALTHFDSRLGVEAHIIAVASSLNCLN